MKQALIAALTFAAFAATDTAQAAGPAGFARNLQTAPTLNYIAEKRRTMAPFAHVMFCAKSPDECKQGIGASSVTLTPMATRELRSVNAAVNRSIIGVNDASDDAGGDVWQANVTRGDCEDFALTKRDRLIAMGWSPRALRIGVAKTSSGEGHAVLVVRTDQGDMVLDNRNDRIKGWRNTDLRWVMIQSGDNPRVWYEL